MSVVTALERKLWAAQRLAGELMRENRRLRLDQHRLNYLQKSGHDIRKNMFVSIWAVDPQPTAPGQVQKTLVEANTLRKALDRAIRLEKWKP